MIVVLLDGVPLVLPPFQKITIIKPLENPEYGENANASVDISEEGVYIDASNDKAEEQIIHQEWDELVCGVNWTEEPYNHLVET